MESILFFGEASRLYRVRDRFDRNVRSVFRQSEYKQYPHKIEDFIIHKKDPKNTVELEINLRPNRSLRDDLKKIISKSQDFSSELNNILPNFRRIRVVGYSVIFNLSEPLYTQEITVNYGSIFEVSKKPSERTKTIYPEGFSDKHMLSDASRLFNENVFTPHSGHPVLDIVSKIAIRILRFIEENAEKLYLISGERGKIDMELHIEERRKQQTPTWIGSKGQHLFEILSRCAVREPKKFNKIKDWASLFQLSDIRAGYTERDILESNFTDTTLKTNLNSALAGLGSRQMLSIITQIFWSEPESIIMIEEPEISLHPKNQVLLHELFSEAILQKKQIICSTHSPFFVLALSKIIKKNLLTTDKIAIYHVEKDEKGTHVTPLKLNKQGFIAKGIPSFMEVEKDLFRDWSESLEEE